MLPAIYEIKTYEIKTKMTIPPKPTRRSSLSARPTTTKKAATKRTAAKKPGAAAERALADEPRFFHRDDSWLRFNERVLEEAADTTNPLLERVKFLAITASNLDEFVEIRVAGVLQKLEDGMGLRQTADESGMTPAERVDHLSVRLHVFAKAQAATWIEHLVPALAKAKIRVVRWKQLNEAEVAFATRYYQEQVDPLLTPVTIDPAHPFPRVLNKALCLALLLRSKRKTKNPAASVLGVVTIPHSLPGLIALPERDGRYAFLPLEDLIEAHIEPMFRGYKIVDCVPFRVTRNSNLYMQEEESRSLLESVAEELHNRRKGDVVRMEIEGGADKEIVERLRFNFELEPWQVFETSAPVNLSRLMSLYSALKLPTLKFAEFHGTRMKLTRPGSIFEEIRKRDILLHHPFDSYNTVEAFIESGATDPQVISIKQTLYRTSADSPIFGALREAAQTTDVTVVVELMARFDEASNIRWARQLEDAGVQVFHGIYGSKTHCKLALIVRRDGDGVIRSYAHLGTGNYNPVTARFYTDISLLTARPELTEAVLRVFRYLTADWEADEDAYQPLLVAPVTLQPSLLELIAREARHARDGKPARIIAKMNGLLDQPIIDALYDASKAGVEIDLIVRGMCSLRPGVVGLSEHIRVRSIIGRFLEHSRIYWFANGGNDEVLCGSADWMPRNLYERCEVVFPVQDAAARQRLREEILETYLRDNLKARVLQPDGSYVRVSPAAGEAPLCAQEWMMQLSRQEAQARPTEVTVPSHAAQDEQVEPTDAQAALL